MTLIAVSVSTAWLTDIARNKLAGCVELRLEYNGENQIRAVL